MREIEVPATSLPSTQSEKTVSPARRPMPNPASIRRILVTAYGHIGDVLPAGPALRALRETYPQAHITMLAQTQVKEMMTACPYLDEFIVLKDAKHKLGSTWSKIERLFQFMQLTPRLYRRFDLVLSFHINIRALTLISWLTGAKVRVGIPASNLPHMVTHMARPPAKTDSYADVNRYVLEAIGITNVSTRLELWPSPGDEKDVQVLLDEYGVSANDLLIGLHPGTHWTCQQWSPKNWAHIADQLVSRYHARIIISGSADEHELAKAIIDHMTVKDASLIDLTGRTSFLGFAALVKRLDVLICVNSSAPKVALAVNTPTLNLVGYENPTWYLPPIHHEPMTIIRGCEDASAIEHWCPYNIWGTTNGCHRAECMGIGGLSLITPAMVLRQVERRVKTHQAIETSQLPG